MHNWRAAPGSQPAPQLDFQRGTKARHLLDRLREHQLTVPACLALLQTALPAGRTLDWSSRGPVAAALELLYSETITVAKCVELLHEAAAPTRKID